MFDIHNPLVFNNRFYFAYIELLITYYQWVCRFQDQRVDRNCWKTSIAMGYLQPPQTIKCPKKITPKHAHGQEAQGHGTRSGYLGNCLPSLIESCDPIQLYGQHQQAAGECNYTQFDTRHVIITFDPDFISIYYGQCDTTWDYLHSLQSLVTLFKV